MKATIKNGTIELNPDYLNSVGGVYTYFYVPNEAMSAELLNAVNTDGPITLINKRAEDYQVQVKTSDIKWED